MENIIPSMTSVSTKTIEKDDYMKKYIVSKEKSGLWYAHREDLPQVPIDGSFSEKKSEASEYARMYMGLPNRVEKIEERKREKFMKEMELV